MRFIICVLVLQAFINQVLSFRPPPTLLRLFSKPTAPKTDEWVDINLINVPTSRGNESLSVRFTNDVALAQFLHDTHSLGLLPQGSGQIHTSITSLNATLPHELYHLPGTPGIIKKTDSFSQQLVKMALEAIGCIALLIIMFGLQYMMFAM